jgi:hypothetical protein
MMIRRGLFSAAIVTAALATAATAAAQGAVVEKRWHLDFGIGFDNSISGNINSSGIGTLNGVSTVITKNKYEDVYGTGLHLRIGGGYFLDEMSELRLTITFQSLDADLVLMGQYGPSNLYGQYDDYQSTSLDFGYRRYLETSMESVRGYGEATVGIAFIDENDLQFVAPGANLSGDATDFYDQTAAFSFAINVGVSFNALKMRNARNLEAFAQLGIRYVTGQAEVDNLVGTGLETINDKSARWSIPFVVGVGFRF